MSSNILNELDFKNGRSFTSAFDGIFDAERELGM